MRILDRTTFTSSSIRLQLAAIAVGAAVAVSAGLTGNHPAEAPSPQAGSVALAAVPPAPSELARVAAHADRSAAVVPRTLPTEAGGAAPPAPEAPAPEQAAAPQPEPAPKPAPKPEQAKPAAPAKKDLHPRPIPGGQQRFKPSKEQLRNAKAIVDTGKKLKLPPRAWVIAVATATQESTLRNLGHLGARNDHDSQGLFQQRPSSGWGSPKQITDPEYASTAFYKALMRVDGWEKMPLTRAAQKVQVSAYPNHYAKWERFAGDIVLGLHGEGPYAEAAADLK